MKIFYVVLSVIMLSCLQGKAQDRLTSRTRFYGENHHGNDLCGVLNRRNFNADVDAQSIVNKVVNAIGLRPNFVLVPCNNIGTCAATVFIKDNLLVDGYRYIIYDSSFMKNIETSSGTDWSSTTIVAHEIAHHLLGHTLGTTNDEANRKEELEADEWSGYASRLLGATLAQAQLALNGIPHPTCAEEGYYDHPCKEKRADAIAIGWTRADNFLRNNTSGRSAISAITVDQVSVTQEHTIYGEDENGESQLGMNIHVKFNIKNSMGREGSVNAYFYQKSGHVLKANKEYGYATTDGNVAGDKKFKPTYENSEFSDFVLFVPYKALNINKNVEYNLKFYLQIFSIDGNNNYTAKYSSPYSEFTITIR